MFGKRKFRKSEHEETNFELQITALIDTLVIILIFMLKTTAMESLETDTQKDLRIPMVHDGQMDNATKHARLSINPSGLFWNGTQLVHTDQFQATVPAAKLGGTQWTQLASVIAETASAQKAENKFEGKLLLEADRDTPYPLLDQALKVARQHGFKDIRFVGARYN